nr:transposase [Streptomyces sp. PvR006]
MRRLRASLAAYGSRREHGIRHRIARKGVDSSRRLGRHRWVVERTVSWLAGCRRLHCRYERKAEHFLAFVGIAAACIGYRRLTRPFLSDHLADQMKMAAM